VSQRLKQENHSNPFNPIITTEFWISKLGFVELKVYNVVGREVKTLVNNPLPVGTCTIRWDGTGSNGQPVSSGVYIYRLKTGNSFTAKKMLLLK